MNFSILMILTTIFSLGYGVASLLVPATLLSFFGMELGDAQQLMVQFFGVALVAIGLVGWFVRNSTDSGTQRGILLAFLASDAVGVVVSVLGTLNNVMSAVGWAAAGIYLVMGLGCAYYLFLRPSSP
jgi:uncharacterized membrane protein YecN with MAPEG domain